MSQVNVNSASGLISALKAAKSGDVIALSKGDYASIDIRNININGNVTITSADPAHQAVINNLVVRNSSGLTFSNLELATNSKGELYPFQILNSSNIRMDNLDVHGTLDGNPQNDKSLMMIRNSSNVTVSNSEFQQAWNALSHLDSKGVTITGNEFHDLRTDAVRGGGTSDLVVSGNYFTNFHPIAGDHPDAIQLWTSNTSKAAQNITITDNVITRGDGKMMQGIFMRDEKGGLAYENVKISGNTVIGGMYHGINVGSAKGLEITDNNVIGLADQKSWLATGSVTNAKVTNNMVTELKLTAQPGLQHSGNVKLQSMDMGTFAKIDDWADSYTGRMGQMSASLERAFSNLFRVQGVLDGTAAHQQALTATLTLSETVMNGTSGADKLYAGKIGDYRLNGGDGNDLLAGGSSGKTTLVGGRGDDNYYIYSDTDVIVEKAGEGNDLAVIYADYVMNDNVEQARMMSGGLTLTGNGLGNRVSGSAGDDIVFGEGGNDFIQSLSGDDELWGGEGDDQLVGGDGNDELYGGAGKDVLTGGSGDDILDGGDGDDQLHGGAGADHMAGGLGADVFIYRAGDFDGGIDVIADFSSAQKDRINLQAIDAKVATAADDKFAFIGTGQFTKVAGQLRYEVGDGDAYVSGDVNGDGRADFTIKLLDVDKLTASDFFL